MVILTTNYHIFFSFDDKMKVFVLFVILAVATTTCMARERLVEAPKGR